MDKHLLLCSAIELLLWMAFALILSMLLFAFLHSSNLCGLHLILPPPPTLTLLMLFFLLTGRVP